ncbi:NAD(P)H-hydrate dehydratase [Planctobacterium marinum]|uniref:Bifunctional NAD(P)H-hydrate repair enzyme n=1 Tax=Planctobacterium marinum TaxID=1631968 RepID=A0AA48HE49_9ALTE|nr:bifunctional NAD(P)H-hydrate repair enzyme [Planctobacterium marinum]
MKTFKNLFQRESLAHNIYTADQVRLVEPRAAELAGVAMYQLMENAGRAVFSLLTATYPEAQRIIVLAGHGNNGGDAYVVARLAIEAGLHCALCELGNPDKLSADASLARTKWLAAQGAQLDIGKLQLSDFDVCVDGMLGTGVSGVVRAPYADVIARLNDQTIPVVSIDIPSGMHADTGVANGIAVQANHTCTFIGIKSGLKTGQGKQLCGQLHFDDLGVGKEFQRLAQQIAKVVDFRNMPAFPGRKINSHKGMMGKLLCIGGNEQYGGAIRLTAEAALRTGTGLVKVFCHEASRQTVNNTRPEIMVETRTEQLQQTLGWSDAIVIGPGLGQDSWSIKVLEAALSHCLEQHKHLVIDADALNLIAEHQRLVIPQNLAIITPHSGEAARLLKVTATEVESDRYKAATRLTQTFKTVSVLKGPGTLITSQGNTWVCENGNPGMATGGMGDVLSGVLGALLSKGISNRLSALYGVCLHSHAADIAAQENGEIGLLASDLFPYIRKLVNTEKTDA